MKKIWQKGNGYYKLEPLSDEMIQKAEKSLNVKLPSSYIGILKEQNGGVIQYDSFPSSLPTTWADDHIHVDHLLGIGEENGILKSHYLIKEWGLPDQIVLISGSGHTWIALDYRETGEEPSILYIDIELEQFIELAPNFEAFLNGLYLNTSPPEDTYDEHEERNWTLEELKTALSSLNEQEVIPAINYLFENPQGHEQFIESSIINLLESPILEIKEMAANYANHFHENSIFSSNGIKKMVSIIRRDNEIEYYADMFFGEEERSE
jgi:hypothetical protein